MRIILFLLASMAVFGADRHLGPAFKAPDGTGRCIAIYSPVNNLKVEDRKEREVLAGELASSFKKAGWEVARPPLFPQHPDYNWLAIWGGGGHGQQEVIYILKMWGFKTQSNGESPYEGLPPPILSGDPKFDEAARSMDHRCVRIYIGANL